MELKEKLSRDEIENIRKDFDKQDGEMHTIFNMAIAFLRFYNRGEAFRVQTIKGGVFIFNAKGELVNEDEIVKMLNDRAATLEQLEECYKAVRKQVTSPIALAEYLNTQWGRNPGRAILIQFAEGNVSLEKMMGLMGLDNASKARLRERLKLSCSVEE